jgi:AraC family transcriptional activator of pyochelin receptor
MYTLSGNEFKDLVKREFTPSLMKAESSVSLPNVFDCQSRSLSTPDFDLLSFQGKFQEDTSVVNFQDATHVSMHFQLAGRSGASISGLPKDQPMNQGQFNVLSCIDPESSFTFPKQQDYAYVCVGLKLSFFNNVLKDCGPSYKALLLQSQKMNSFSLFESATATTYLQLSALNLLQSTPVADNLKEGYTRSKVKELIFLALNTYGAAKQQTNHISSLDLEKLNAVKEYLTLHYLSPLTLESISRQFLLNEFKLKKGFKHLFGLTVFGYIHELRMHHAQTLLLAGRLTIGETAAIIGYTSDSSFIRAFKRTYGYSPGKM